MARRVEVGAINKKGSIIGEVEPRRWVPQGIGPINCLGKRYALTHLMLTLSWDSNRWILIHVFR